MQLREIDVGGHAVRHRVAGAGEPLVLVHGLSGSWRWWAPLVDLLSDSRRVYMVDLPRRRRTPELAQMATWLSRWLDAVGIGSADFAGHSLGGLFAAQLAARHPSRVRRLVLVAPVGVSCGRGLSRRALPLVRTLYDIRSSLPMVVADAGRTGGAALARGVRFASRSDVRAELSAVRAPTLLAWGEDDRLVPVRLAEDWQRFLPRTRVVRLRCGHVPMLEAPRALADAMLLFFAEELADDPGDEIRPRVVDRVGLGRHDDEPTAG